MTRRMKVLYHERDSHWNNKGAALAADAIMTDLVKIHDSYKDETYEIRTDHIGDLDKMLYPRALTPEDEVYYDKATTFAYVGEVESNFDPKITTVNPVKEGSLVMYRIPSEIPFFLSLRTPMPTLIFPGVFLISSVMWMRRMRIRLLWNGQNVFCRKWRKTHRCWREA